MVPVDLVERYLLHGWVTFERGQADCDISNLSRSRDTYGHRPLLSLLDDVPFVVAFEILRLDVETIGGVVECQSLPSHLFTGRW